MILQALASGSNGNSFLIHHQGRTILIDAGISRKRIIEGIILLEINPSTLDYVLITHAHSDHVAGLAVLHSYTDFRVLATGPTIDEIRKLDRLDPRFALVADQAIRLDQDIPQTHGGITITPRDAIHDIAGSVGFTIDYDEIRVCYTTDNSEIVPEFAKDMQSADFLIIESNHDIDMLAGSRRPVWLKQRIRNTHMANSETVISLKSIISDRLKVLFLAHLSGECNNLEVVEKTYTDLKLYFEKRRVEYNDWNWVICPRHESSTVVRYGEELVLEMGISNLNIDNHDFKQPLSLEKYLGNKNITRTRRPHSGANDDFSQ